MHLWNDRKFDQMGSPQAEMISIEGKEDETGAIEAKREATLHVVTNNTDQVILMSWDTVHRVDRDLTGKANAQASSHSTSVTCRWRYLLVTLTERCDKQVKHLTNPVLTDHNEYTHRWQLYSKYSGCENLELSISYPSITAGESDEPSTVTRTLEL